jgi:hypothetical protein
MMKPTKGICAMGDYVISFADSDDSSLEHSVGDEELERAAASINGQITTYVYCTYAWYICGPNQ